MGPPHPGRPKVEMETALGNMVPSVPSPLQPDACGIPAPLSNPVLAAADLSLLLVPALAADTTAIRLGYGRGYYDRLRAKQDWKGCKSILILPQACLYRIALPRDPWDVPYHGWITEHGAGFPN